MDTVLVPISGGRFHAIIDADDADKIVGHLWCYSSTRSGKMYAQRRLRRSEGGKVVKMHRVIMGVLNDGSIAVDHINGNTFDNRKANLRLCSLGENMRNYRHSWGNEGVRGISKTRGGKYRARIRYNLKLYEIGTFDTIHDASVAYAFASSLLHGDFGSLPGHEKFLQRNDGDCNETSVLGDAIQS